MFILGFKLDRLITDHKKNTFLLNNFFYLITEYSGFIERTLKIRLNVLNC